MSDKELKIKLHVDDTQAQAAARRAKQSTSDLEAGWKKAGDAQEGAGKKGAESLEKSTGIASKFHDALGGVVGQFVALQTAQRVVAMIGEGFEKAAQGAEAAQRATIEYRKALREDAALGGEGGPNNRVVGQNLALRLQTGLSQQEASEFYREWAGGINIGVEKGNITQKTADAMMPQAAAYAARVGGSVRTRSKLGTAIAQFGKVDSVESGMGQMEAIRMALVEGRGDDAPLTEALIRTAGTMVKEGGFVGSLPEHAALTGVMSLAAGPEEAATRTLQLNRALRAGLIKQTKGKGAESSQADYLKGLHITESMTLEQMLGKLAPDLAKAEGSGRNLEVYLGEHGFRNQEERQAITEVFRVYKQFTERMAKARASAGRGAEVMQANEEFRRSDLGAAMTGDAAAEAAQVVAGAAGQGTVGAMSRAKAQERLEFQDQSAAGSVRDTMLGMGSSEAGARLRRQLMIRSQLARQANKVGASVLREDNLLDDLSTAFWNQGTPAEFNKYVKEQSRLIREKGGDPMAGFGDPGAKPGEGFVSRFDQSGGLPNTDLAELSAAIRENTEATRATAPKGQPLPAAPRGGVATSAR